MVQHKFLVKFILIKLSIITTCSNAANIFCIFPTASYSHQQPMLVLSRALAAKGHNLTVITTNPSEVPIKNHREIDMNFLYGVFNNTSNLEQLEKDTGFTPQKRQSSALDLINAMPVIIDLMSQPLYNSSKIQNLIREVNGTNYDLIIAEEMIVSSLLGFGDLIGNPPIIGILTFSVPSFVDAEYGNPVIPSYVPVSLAEYTDRMSLWDRFMNLWLTLYFDLYIYNMYIRPAQEKMMRENFGNIGRKLWELESNKSLLIISADLATVYPKPVQPNTIFVGPLYVKTPPALPKDLQKYMDEAEEEVIYFSLGSNMKGMSVPEDKRAAFIKAFKQFPKTRVLWKWEADVDLPGRPDNVLTRKWLPQQSVLAHPKVKVFISQAGLQSFQEATYFGIPLLSIPMFADQDYNANKLVSAGAGLKVEFQNINYNNIYKNLEQLLTNTSFKENMMRLSSITKDKPMSAVDTAVWWVEYVIRHKGAPHLRPASLDLTWYQYYMLDIFTILIFVISTSLFLIYYIVIIIIKKLSPSLSASSKNNSKKMKIN